MRREELGRMVTALEDWREPFAGRHLYYPSQRRPRRLSPSSSKSCSIAASEPQTGLKPPLARGSLREPSRYRKAGRHLHS